MTIVSSRVNQPARNNMKKFKLSTIFLIALLSSCEYLPREEFKIKTESGDIITLACPVVDAGRSEFTYIIDGDCVVYKK